MIPTCNSCGNEFAADFGDIDPKTGTPTCDECLKRQSKHSKPFPRINGCNRVTQTTSGQPSRHLRVDRDVAFSFSD